MRWQVHRDLLRSPARVVAAERARIATEGWGARLLALQGASGRWAEGEGPRGYRGLYTPKWTSTTYTLLLLARMGLPARNAQALAGCRALVEGGRWLSRGEIALWDAPRSDACVDAMVLFLLEAFDYPDETVRSAMATRLVRLQHADGGWNCRVHDAHSSFNTTIAALEALQLRASKRGVAGALRAGREFLLAHRLFRSHRTGRVASSVFTRLRVSVGWQYDVLRALDHFVASGAAYDARMDDALGLMRGRRLADGRWKGTEPQAGKLHFELERAGQPSRWVTLRCLRALRAFEAPTDRAGVRP